LERRIAEGNVGTSVKKDVVPKETNTPRTTGLKCDLNPRRIEDWVPK